MAALRFGLCLAAAAALLPLAGADSSPPVPRAAPLLLQRRRSSASAAAEAQVFGSKSQATASASSAATSDRSQGQSAAGKAALPEDASFFDSFSEGESTYDLDGDVGFTRDGDGWEPTLNSPYGAPGTSATWFHESPSGGADVAWQTHYPALQTGLAGRAVTLGKWVRGSGGSWTQEYVPTGNTRTIQSGKLKLPAKWFDNGINQLDGFGRPKLPDSANPDRFVGWLEQAVNTTMSCSSPGCVATAALQAFDGKKLKARSCRLNIFVQHYSGKSIEWMSVNGANVSSQCQVPANNCSATGARPLYPCVFELSLDKLISQTGTLDISAKLLDSADADCTYDSNLLLAVPMATCMVSNLTWPSPTNLTNYAPPNATSLASVGIKLRQKRVAAHPAK